MCSSDLTIETTKTISRPQTTETTKTINKTQFINETQASQKTQVIDRTQAINKTQTIDVTLASDKTQAPEIIYSSDTIGSIQGNIINRTEALEDILNEHEKIREINKIIDARVQSQVKSISKQVYENIEQRLRGEKRRRGF